MIKRAVASLLKWNPRLWLYVRGHWRYLFNLDEPEVALLRFLVPPGAYAIDVGANEGVYTGALLRVGAKVVAIEPNPVCAAELFRIFKNRIRLVRAAASDRPGSIEMRVPKRDRHATALGTIEVDNRLTGYEFDTTTVQLVRIDDLGLSGVGFIKVDVEGHEDAVIAGAEETIRKCRPNLLIESEERHKPNAVGLLTDRLAKLGYQGFFLERGMLRPIADFVVDLHQASTARQHAASGHRDTDYCNNFIFLPKSVSAARDE